MTQVEARGEAGRGESVGDESAREPARRADRLRAAVPPLAAIVTILAFLPFASLDIDSHHDGFMLKPALDLVAGQTLFRETMSVYGALNAYIQAGSLYVLGPTLVSLRIGTVVMYGLAAGFLAAAWGRLLPVSLTVLSLVLWLALAYFYRGSILHPWASVNGLAFQAAAVYFLLRSAPAARADSWAWPMLCGASAGLCYWCRYNVGLPLIAALGVAYVILGCAVGERPWASRRLYAFVAGNVAVHLAFLAIIVGTHATDDWIYQNYTYYSKFFVKSLFSAFGNAVRCMLVPPALRFDFWGSPLRALLPLVPVGAGIAAMAWAFLASMRAGAAGPGVGADRGEGAAARRGISASTAVALAIAAVSILVVAWYQPPYEFWFWYYAIPYLVLAAAVAISANWVVSLVRGRRAAVAEPVLAGYLAGLVALASWSQYFPLADGSHCYWGLVPGIGVFVFFVLWLARGRVLAVAMALGALAMPLVIHQAEIAIGTLRQPRVTIRNNPVLAGMRLRPGDDARWSPLLAALEGYVAEHPRTAILVYGPDALIATLVPDLTNPSNFWFYDLAYPVPRPEEILARRREFIRERKPLIFFSFHDTTPVDLNPKTTSAGIFVSARVLQDDYNRGVRSTRDLRANMEEIVRDYHYVELAHWGRSSSDGVLLRPAD